MEVSRCDVELDGQKIRVKNFKEKARTVRKVVKYMKGSDVIDTTAQHLFSFDWPYQQGVATLDFEGMKGKTVTVDEEGGDRVTFAPAAVLDVGEYTLDDENEKVSTIEWWAVNRTPE
jgi:hypothetical protein